MDRLGHWYLPNSTAPVTIYSHRFYSNRGPSVVRLHRRQNATALPGVFHCEIPDNNGISHSIYVGVYSQEDGVWMLKLIIILMSVLLSSLGMPSITDISFHFTASNQTLTCTSVGGPATSVTWIKNGVPLVPKHAQVQEITDFVASTYLNVLLLGEQHPDNINGSYICVVNNSRGSDKMNFELHGEILLSRAIQFT